MLIICEEARLVVGSEFWSLSLFINDEEARDVFLRSGPHISIAGLELMLTLDVLGVKTLSDIVVGSGESHAWVDLQNARASTLIFLGVFF